MTNDYVTSKQFDDFLHEEREHHDRQEARVGDVERRVSDVHNAVVDLRAHMEREYKARLDRHAKTLYGNGEPGMDEQIRRIYEWIEEQKNAAKDGKAEIKKYVFWGVTFLVSQGVGILIALLTLK